MNIEVIFAIFKRTKISELETKPNWPTTLEEPGVSSGTSTVQLMDHFKGTEPA